MGLLNPAYSVAINSFPIPPGFPKMQHIPLVSDLDCVIFLELIPSLLPAHCLWPQVVSLSLGHTGHTLLTEAPGAVAFLLSH